MCFSVILLHLYSEIIVIAAWRCRYRHEGGCRRQGSDYVAAATSRTEISVGQGTAKSVRTGRAIGWSLTGIKKNSGIS